MNAATTSLLDQAQAATHHSLAILQNVAVRINGACNESQPGPIAARLLERFHTGVHTLDIAFCPHLTATTPQPAFWVPYAAGLIRCPACMSRRLHRSLKGTETHRCDNCRRRAVTIHVYGVQIPAVVLELSDRAVSLPPVQIHFGLCPPCKQIDQQPVKATA
ncbi:hypothetical protein GCM10022419_008030 [Nonomuraea rosea]|uniref:Uncharacterized protein n=1 Tax=Nonomuraea rosea TaxID=638574 RepID=A0ABP6VE79_9ACTN